MRHLLAWLRRPAPQDLLVETLQTELAYHKKLLADSIRREEETKRQLLALTRPAALWDAQAVRERVEEAERARTEPRVEDMHPRDPARSLVPPNGRQRVPATIEELPHFANSLMGNGHMGDDEEGGGGDMPGRYTTPPTEEELAERTIEAAAAERELQALRDAQRGDGSALEVDLDEIADRPARS